MDSALFARQLEKGFDTKASGELNPGVSPVHVLTLESEHNELRYLRLERFAANMTSDGAVAGQFCHVGLRNPANSGAIISVLGLWVINDTGAAATRQYGIGIGKTPTVDAEGAGFLTDVRYGPTTTVRATGRVFHRTQAAQMGQAFRRILSVSPTMTVIEHPIVLGPDDFVVIQTFAVNEPIAQAGFWWVERAAESGELQGSGV